MQNFQFFPEQASTFAGQIDLLYFILITLSLIFAGVIPFVILYFIVRYHRSMKANRKNPVHSSLTLELSWSIIPFVIAMGIFFWSAWLFFDMNKAPTQALEIYVIGKQWMWHIQHPNGKRENNQLHMPIGQPVKLIMTSQDVIHSFFVPAFRVKKDVVPGRYTTLWFEATKTGDYHLFCTEYCGTEHSAMIGTVTVMSLPDYQRWLNTPGPVILQGGATSAGASASAAPVGSLAEAGAQLFSSLGCAGCHRGDGAGVGPALDGIFGKEVQLASGETVTVDENYIRESIVNPQAKIVAGYNPVMPTYATQVTPEQLLQLIAYVKSLSE